MKRIAFVFSLLLLTACLGCGGGSSPQSSPTPPLSAPRNLKVDTTFENLGQIALIWDPPNVAFDGYWLEVSQDNGAFTRLNQTLFPNTTIKINISWQDQYIPELVFFKFRVYLARGSENSPFSEVNYRKSIYSPFINLHVENVDGVFIGINSNSRIAKKVVILRSLADSNNNPINYEEIKILKWNNSAIIFTDTEVEDNRQYFYKICLRTETNESEWVEVISPIVPIKSPSNFKTTNEINSVRLTWKKPNKNYDTIKLRRRGLSIEEISIPVDVNEYIDFPGLPGIYQYQLFVQSGYDSRNTQEITGNALNPPESPTAILSPFNGPPAFVAVQDSQKNWICAGQDINGRNILRAYTESGLNELLLETGSNFLNPTGIGAANGNHRFMYYFNNPADTTKSLIKSAWFENGQWKFEEIGSFTRDLDTNQITANFALTPIGDPIISLHRGDGGMNRSVLIGKLNENWTISGLYAGYEQVFQKSTFPVRYNFSYVITSTGNFPYNWTAHNLEVPPTLVPTGIKIGDLVSETQLWTCWEVRDGDQNVFYSATYQDGAWTQPEVMVRWRGYSAIYWFARPRLTISPNGIIWTLFLNTPIGLTAIYRVGSGPWKWANLGTTGYPAGCVWDGERSVQILNTNYTPVSGLVQVRF